MTSKIRLAGLAGALALVAAPAFAKTLNGSYTLTYLSGPSHTMTATQCLSFTTDGSIVGFPNSGAWVATTFSGFGGNFVVDGTDVRFFGTFGGGSGIIAHHGTYAKVIRGGFDDFSGTSGGASSANDGRITLKKGCTDAAQFKPASGISPTH